MTILAPLGAVLGVAFTAMLYLYIGVSGQQLVGLLFNCVGTMLLGPSKIFSGFIEPTLGLFIGSAVTGQHASPESYGHGGSQSSMGFCDPRKRIAACVACNCRPGPKRHYERMARIASAMYEDFGLASDSAG